MNLLVELLTGAISLNLHGWRNLKMYFKMVTTAPPESEMINRQIIISPIERKLYFCYDLNGTKKLYEIELDKVDYRETQFGPEIEKEVVPVQDWRSKIKAGLRVVADSW